jgi:hypothetical protein
MFAFLGRIVGIAPRLYMNQATCREKFNKSGVSHDKAGGTIRHNEFAKNP